MGIVIVNNGKIKSLSNGKQYDGEKIPGDLKNWDYFGNDPNDLLTYTYDILSQRSTTLYHTHPPVSAAINKLTTYAIGSGLVFRSQPDWQILGMTKEAGKEWGMRFQKLIHYLFMITNFYEKQAILFRTAKIQGDSLLFFDRSTEVMDGLFDLVETGGAYINWQKNEKNKATLGIKHDSALRKIGVYLTDGGEMDFRDRNGDQNLLQYIDKQMARQLRGFPLAYKIISQAKNNDRWWDAMLARAVMETTILGYSKSDDSATDMFDQSAAIAALAIDGQTKTPEGLKAEGNLAQIPGQMYQFSSKGGIEFTDLKTPSNNFDKMQAAYIDIVGMATDVPPECIMSRYSTSYTAHKGAFNDFIKSYMTHRMNFIRKIIKPVIMEFAKYLFLNKMIEMPNAGFFDSPIIREATIAGNFLGPVPGHINPAQEVNAKAEEVKNAFRLRSDVALEYGNEFENMITEWQQEETEFNKQNPDLQAAKLQTEMQNTEEQQEEPKQTQEDENENA